MLTVFVVGYLAVNLVIGWWASRRVKSAADFALAGKQLPLFLASSALFATWFGSETILGASSVFAEKGLIGVIEDPFGAALCLLLVGLFYARPLYRMNILTFNDFYRLRFGRRAEWISAVLMVPSYFGWIAAQLVAMAVVLQVLLGVSFYWGIVLCTAVVVFYTYVGGMWAISVTDFVQALMIVGGLGLFAYTIAQEAGGVTTVIAAAPEGFFRFFPERTLMDWLVYLTAWFTIGLGSIPQQDVFQRVMAAKSEKIAVYSAHLSAFFYVTLGLLPLFIGLAAKQLHPELLQGDAQLLLPEVVQRHGSMWLQVLFFGALLSAILSSTSGGILAPATVIGENLIRPQRKNLTDAQLLQVMRWSVVGVAICSALMACWRSNIYELVAQSSAISFVSLFMPLTFGLYSRWATERGALWAMFLGSAVWLGCEAAGTEVPPFLLGGAGSLLGMLAGSFLPGGKPQKSPSSRRAAWEASLHTVK